MIKRLTRNPVSLFLFMWMVITAIIMLISDEHFLVPLLVGFILSIVLSLVYLVYHLIDGPVYWRQFERFWGDRYQAKSTPSESIPQTNQSVDGLRSIKFISDGNKGRVVLGFGSGQDTHTTSIDDLSASEFWLFYYLAVEHDSDSTTDPWLQFPELHLETIDIISNRWFGHDFITQLDQKYNMEYGSAIAHTINNRDDLKRAITEYDKHPLQDLYDLRKREGLSWMFDVNGDNRKNLRSSLVKRLSRETSQAAQLFTEAKRKIAYRPNAFQINPSLNLDISLPDLS